MQELTFICRKDKQYTTISTKGNTLEDLVTNKRVKDSLSTLEGCNFSLYRTKGYREQEQVLEAVFGTIVNGQLLYNKSF